VASFSKPNLTTLKAHKIIYPLKNEQQNV
jgi:hypothetical protein